MSRSLLALLLSLSAVAVDAAQYHSGEGNVAAIELFTSQGCSSCPPADHRLTRLIDHPGLWKRFVPMAWHVDYWDYLGWRDPFASRANSQRQSAYRQVDAVRVVYTPGFFRDGREWRDWRADPAIGEKVNPVGRLDLGVDGEQATLTLTPAAGADTRDLIGHVAILGFQLATPVERGENRGDLLHEDFVVLRHQTLHGEGNRWRLTLDASDLPGQRHALAAWVSRGPDPRPLQMTGGWWERLPRP